MKTTYLKYTPVLLVALFASSNASALPYGGTKVGAYGGEFDYQQYKFDPSTGYLEKNNAAPLSSVININNNGNTGNTELLTSSDTMNDPTYSAFSAGGGNTTLTASFSGGPSGTSYLVLSSLNHNDWASGLLTDWSTDILNEFAPGYTPQQLAQFIGLFQLYGGEQRLSDPNIQSINSDGTTAYIGLAGFWDASVFNESLPEEVAESGLIPEGALVSEIVKVTAFDSLGTNLGSQYLYAIGMNTDPDPVATQSGVQTKDGSYNANFLLTVDIPGFEPGPEVSVPEPTELALLIAGLAGFLGLRRKAVKS